MTFIEKSSPMELSLPDFPEPVRLSFFADYEIKIVAERVALLKPQQLVLLRAIVSSSSALRDFSRMSFDTDLEDLRGAGLDKLFPGPPNEELWRCVMACLPEAEKGYWLPLKDQENGAAYDKIIEVLMVFEVTLCRAGVKERSAAGEKIVKLVGPTLEADKS